MKFYLKHHWGGGKASIAFDLDLFRTLDSMPTVSSQRVTVGKTASSNTQMVSIGTFLILAGNDDMHESLDEFAIWVTRLRWPPCPYMVKPFEILLRNRQTDFHKSWYVALGTPAHHYLFK